MKAEPFAQIVGSMMVPIGIIMMKTVKHIDPEFMKFRVQSTILMRVQNWLCLRFARMVRIAI